MYVVFTAYPVFRQFEISFFNWHIFPGASNPFVGWSNYTKIFHDPVVRTAACNSLLWVVLTVPVQIFLGLFAAAVLTDRLPGSIFWRAAVYIPVVTSYVVVSWVFSYLFASQGGGGQRSPWIFHRPQREHQLDGGNLDHQRRDVAPYDLERRRLVIHNFPGGTRRSTPRARWNQPA